MDNHTPNENQAPPEHRRRSGSRAEHSSQTAERDHSASTDRRPVADLRPHPQADVLPPLARQEYRSFLADVQRRGVLVPLDITPAGVVLDGHVRLRAALELGLKELPVRELSPPDELEYLFWAALRRRHLSASQKAALAVEFERYQHTREQARTRRLANLKHQPVEVATLPPRGKTRDHAAAWAGVSPRTIQDAATVQAADPDLFEQVKHGRLPVDRAARQVRQRERDAALPPAPPLPTGPFQLIYADPPWRLPGNPSSCKAIENHYPTMHLEEIKALPVPAADDCLLFLWGVNSMTPEAIEVMQSWGFSYANHFAWVKDKWGLGQWNRTQHELLHVGHRGNASPPPPANRCSSVIHAPRGRHSAKPPLAYELIEAMYPRLSKVELFARTARPGWTPGATKPLWRRRHERAAAAARPRRARRNDRPTRRRAAPQANHAASRTALALARRRRRLRLPRLQP
jgi:N6-adenosine-specific RNA methylase IME4